MIKTKAHWPVTCTDTGEVVSNYREYLRSEHWTNLKHKYRKSKLYKGCAICKTKENLNFHHRSYVRIGSEYLRDIVPLCSEHHKAVHDFDKTSSKSLWSNTTRFGKAERKKLAEPTKKVHKKKRHKKPAWKRYLDKHPIAS